MSISNDWFVCPKSPPGARWRLFCFPHAGGGAVSFYSWLTDIPAGIELCAVALPGREHRAQEPSYRRLVKLADDLASHISPRLDRPFAFFGHSIGAWLAFELARALRRKGLPLPAHLFVSGNYAPHLRVPRLPYQAPDDEFIDTMQRYFNGIPRELLDEPEYLRLFLPAVRADIEMLMTYEYRPAPPLECPITALRGTEDPWVNEEAVRAWQEHTQSAFAMHALPGDHFFVQTSRQRILDRIARTLMIAAVPSA